jgi:hypothetical protein
MLGPQLCFLVSFAGPAQLGVGLTFRFIAAIQLRVNVMPATLD